ncbi:MAG: murein biosynthesis integral membrane protein MurJ [Chloroflexi bacterium]|nr:murein biosynthesis integral membrane protein MurJ [Chloroflexota bacterium]
MTIEQALEEPSVPREALGESAANTGLVRAAAIIAAGNVASRVLGLARESVIAYLFGATGHVSAFRVASTLVQQLYDFLVGGMASAALVPILSDFAARKNRDELWRVASIVVNTLAVVLALAVLVLEVFAPQLVWIYGAGYDPALQDATVQMIRLALPAVFFLGLSGIITGLLYALKRFVYPAFTAAAFNAAIVILALALSPIFGIASLLVGIVVGAAVQVMLQLPGLRDMRYRLTIDFTHPALARILRLYVPVIGGLAIAQVGVAVDRYLVSFTGEQSLAWMQDATVLIQFPLGLAATAVSFAILPTLSRQATQNRELRITNYEFQSTLAFGVKLVLLLIVPAAVGLFVLAQPIVALLFERGAFTANDTFWTSTVLRFYLIGLPFAAIDQPLVFAFYARKNTLAPNLVAFAGVAIYLIVALALIQSLGMIGLVLANSAQLTGHALIMVWLTQARLGGFGQAGIGVTIAKVSLASAAMGLLAFAIESAVGPLWLKVAAPAIAGAGAYIALLWLLRVREAERVLEIVWARVRRV